MATILNSENVMIGKHALILGSHTWNIFGFAKISVCWGLYKEK